MLSKAQVKARPTVLWCYKKELDFSTLVILNYHSMKSVNIVILVIVKNV
jgi:hypothetical protein